MAKRHDDDEIPTIHAPPPREVLEEKPLPLRVALTPEEQRAKGLRLADLVREHTEMLAAHKEKRAEMKAEIESINAKVLDCRYDVSSCTEVRAVDCEVIADFGRGVVETIRIDTGAVVASRPINADDRQRRLP